MELDGALETLARGGVVAAATESFFGFLCDAANASAVDRLLSIKARGADKGIPLILPEPAAWLRWVRQIPKTAELLARALWPGPLTIALPAADHVDPRIVLDGTVAVRCPGPCPAAEIARHFGRALTATSANAPAEPALTQSERVREAFALHVAQRRLTVMDGDCQGGQPSTIVRIDADGGWRLVRPGPISLQAIERLLRSASAL
jgi:L-threonylcarbamoyladenylate synthase